MACGGRDTNWFFYVCNLEEAYKSCKLYGFRKITKPVEATAYSNNRIIFVAHKKFGLFELIEDVDKFNEAKNNLIYWISCVKK